MKSGIHPKYVPVVITCMGCGTKIETRSTKGRDFNIDVCSSCHPFYTGRQKFVDSAGRVERFQKKWSKTTAVAKAAKEAKEAKEAKKSAAAKPAPEAAAITPAEAPKPDAPPEVPKA